MLFSKQYLGQVGVVKGKRSGSIVVQFPDGAAYDIVVIEKNKDRVKELQEGHGGWKASLVSVLGKNGIVNQIDENGDVFVEFPHTTNQWFNPKLLTVVDTTNVKIRVGDLVVVIDSYKKVKALQDKAHGGWTNEMRKVIIDFIIEYL
ncbi:hypothetical protein LSAT2_008785 [Lamellibrachia satsuma]|nr:hypothetical protein LSAT2_008785 [Lamellibrachia satsuma]